MYIAGQNISSLAFSVETTDLKSWTIFIYLLLEIKEKYINPYVINAHNIYQCKFYINDIRYMNLHLHKLTIYIYIYIYR